MIELFGLVVVACAGWYFYSDWVSKQYKARLAQQFDLNASEFLDVFGVSLTSASREEFLWSIASSQGYKAIIAELETYGGLRNALDHGAICKICVPDWRRNLVQRFPLR